MGVSIKPSNLSSGGILNDVVMSVSSSRFEMFAFGDSGERPAIVFRGETEDGEERVQAWSCGKEGDWSPSEDGRELLPLSSKTSLHEKSNAGMLLASLINSGFPEEDVDEDISVFEGGEYHFIQVKPEGREDLEDEDGHKRKVGTVPIVDQIVNMPGKGGSKASSRSSKTSKSSSKTAKASSKVKPADKASSKSKATDKGGDDDESRAKAAILATLEEMGDEAKEQGVNREDLGSRAYSNVTGRGKQAVLNIILDADWLGSADHAEDWEFDESDDTVYAV